MQAKYIFIFSILDITTSAISQTSVILQDFFKIQIYVGIMPIAGNSKQRYNTNFQIGDAEIEDGNKPLFLRKLAGCLE